MAGGQGFWTERTPGGGSAEVTVEEIFDASYTVTAGDSNKVLRFTSSADVTVTLPAGLEPGVLVHLVFEAAAGGTVVAGPGTSVAGSGVVHGLGGEASCLLANPSTWAVLTTTPRLLVDVIAADTYTPLARDAGRVKRFIAVDPTTVTLPAGMPEGTIVELLAWGAGGLVLAAGSGAIVEPVGTVAQFDTVSCAVVAPDTWSVVGPVEP